jgi:hypothetical protein
LTLTNDGNGTTSPSGSAAVTSGVAKSISATPNTGYRFGNWTVTSGSASIADPNSYSTTVTCTDDAAIRANFSAGSIYDITSTNQSYNYTTHYYQGTSPGSLPGVAFRFTAPEAGSYSIVVEDIEESYKYLYNYGTSSTFSSYTTVATGYGTLTYIFTVSADDTLYFGVRPYYSSSYTNNFNIRYTTMPTLSVTNDGHETTSPSGSIAVSAGVARSISATPSSGYRFCDWSVTSGSATIEDATAYSTNVTITDDATIQANFITGVVYSISNTDESYNFTTHYYNGTSPDAGVAFRFTAPSAGSFMVVVDDDGEPSTKSLTNYGSDGTFTSAVSSVSGSGLLTRTVTATSDGEEFYFKVFPSMTSFWSNDFTIRYATTPTLTITNDGHGTTTLPAA